MVMPGGTILMFLPAKLKYQNFVIDDSKMPEWLFMIVLFVMSY